MTIDIDSFNRPGVGRTTMLLRATPNGGKFVVPTSYLEKYVTKYLEFERPSSGIEVMSLDRFREWMKGRSGYSVCFDHSNIGLREDYFEVFLAVATRVPEVTVVWIDENLEHPTIRVKSRFINEN